MGFFCCAQAVRVDKYSVSELCATDTKLLWVRGPPQY